mmetsp:Transcript_1698/g.5331  ORF Transcript_1698/g.5331 Transcript_1698/m.5331 type:complete len:264 (-) Transcript_1698:2232-3023(-)
MSSVTPVVVSFACSAIKATLAEAAAASALAASTNEAKQSCASDCGSQEDFTFSAAAWASDLAASNAACSASQPNEDDGMVIPSPSSSKHDFMADTDAVHSFNLFPFFSASAFASSTAFVVHSGTSLVHSEKFSESSVAPSSTSFCINAAFALANSKSASIFVFIFSPHAAKSPAQACNSAPAASASALNLATVDSNSSLRFATISSAPKEKVSSTSLPICSKQDGKSMAQDCILSPAALASACAFSTDAVTHSLMASASPMQC